jgi:hypothetical protein
MIEPTPSPTLRTDLWAQADQARAAADHAGRELARQLLLAADVLDDLAADAGPDANTPTVPCHECGEPIPEEHADDEGPTVCEECQEEAACPCCAALDAGDLEVAYLARDRRHDSGRARRPRHPHRARSLTPSSH